MLRFDEGVAVVQKGGRGGCEPYCQNLRPRYRSTHRHTLEEPTEGEGREREEREREGRGGVKGRERLDAEMRQKGEEGKKDASRKPKERRFISIARVPR